MTSTDDTAPLITPDPEGSNAVTWGQGRLIAYDNQTGENIVDYRGARLTNLPTTSGPETLTLGPGDVVAIMAWRSQHFILGRVVRPPFAESGADFLRTALAREIAAEVLADRMTTATISGVGARESTTFGDCDDQVGPIVSGVQVTAGTMLVECGARITFGGPTFRGGGLMSFDVDGPTPSSAGGSRFVEASIDGMNIASFNLGRTFRVSGLTPGEYTVTAKYRTAYADDVGTTFEQRIVTVTAL